VLDAGGVADWGAITWGTDPAADASIALRTRTGNTAYPDATWSPWSAAYAGGREAIASPAGRYLQYRAEFAAGSTAALQYVKVFRLNRNRPPTVEIAAPAGGSLWSGSKQIRWQAKDPDDDSLTFEVFASSDGGETWKQIERKAEEPAAPDAEQPSGEGNDEAQPAEEEAAALISALARESGTSPAAGDEAPAGVLERLRKAAEAEPAPEETEQAEEPAAPKQQEKELKSKSLSWDTAKEKDGTYLVKVVASDASANPTDAQTAQAVSEPVVVDNTPPALALRGARGRLREPESSYLCSDATSYVASAEYRVDEGKWVAAAAADRVFDSPQERILLKPEDLPFGAHTLELRLRDGAGNEKTWTIGYLRRQPDR
jgi:hypothetical protein